jgi:hypothetical protein
MKTNANTSHTSVSNINFSIYDPNVLLQAAIVLLSVDSRNDILPYDPRLLEAIR